MSTLAIVSITLCQKDVYTINLPLKNLELQTLLVCSALKRFSTKIIQDPASMQMALESDAAMKLSNIILLFSAFPVAYLYPINTPCVQLTRGPAGPITASTHRQVHSPFRATTKQLAIPEKVQMGMVCLSLPFCTKADLPCRSFSTDHLPWVCFAGCTRNTWFFGGTVTP